MKSRVDAVDNMQASRRPVAADLNVVIQTPRLNIAVAPEFDLIQLQYSHRRRTTVSGATGREYFFLCDDSTAV
jgi:hypothetical protein